MYRPPTISQAQGLRSVLSQSIRGRQWIIVARYRTKRIAAEYDGLPRMCHPPARLLFSVIAALVLGALAIGAPATAPAVGEALAPVASQHLHNAHVVNAKVISGAQPEGDQAFAELKAMGIRTIISVDGATPDVERARKFGMRYVHLPIGCDNVEVEEGMAIAKAIQPAAVITITANVTLC